MVDDDKHTQSADEHYDRQEDAFAQTYQQIIEANAEIVAEYTERFQQDMTLPWDEVQQFNYHTVVNNGITLGTSEINAELKWLGHRCVHLRVSRKDAQIKQSYAIVDAKWQRTALSATSHNKIITIHSQGINAKINTQTGVIQLHYGDIWLNDIGAMKLREYGGADLTCRLSATESSYGTGARTFDINLRGRKLSLWNTDPGAYYRTEEPINYCIPLYIGVRDNLVYGILWDNPARGTIDIGATNTDELAFYSERGHINAYIFVGDDIDAVLEQYTHLTGHMPMPPLWALGYHQSRYSYMDQEEVLKIAQGFRERQIPCDALYLDIHYMDGYRIFTWDKRAFPDLAGMITQLNAHNLKLVPIVDPGVKVDPDYFGYQNGIYDEIFVKYPNEEPAAGVVWPGLTHMPDFTSAKARDWWTTQLGALLKRGIAGIWNDMNEPLFFGEDEITYLPDYAQHDYEGQNADHVEAHNVYGMQMARASREALQKTNPNKRPFCITRAGYAGAQRYASSWTGDNRSSWDQLRLSISMVLNMALSGQSFTGPDIGGFADDTTPELLARWTQAGSLLPFFRNHSAVDTIHQEPWLFGDEIETICREAIQLRYDLMPYLYTAFVACHTTGSPIVQPLFTTDLQNLALRQIDDCYLVGANLLVAPIMQEGSIRRNVFLPPGEWIDFWQNKRYQGNQVIAVEASLEVLPLFVRAGTVLPMWRNLKHLDNTPNITQLRVYSGNGSSRLYQDAGEGFDYEKGQYRLHQFEMKRSKDETTVTLQTQGDWEDECIFEVIYMGQYASIEVEGGDIEGQSIHENERALRIRTFDRLIFKDF